MTDEADRLYERVLVLRCQAGDEDAFAELVARYGPRLRYYLRKMLGPGHHVEDVLQDVWLEAFRGVPRLEDAGAFAPWLYRIARHRSARHWRRRGPAVVPLEQAGAVAQANGLAFSAEDAARIHAALEVLPEEHREVLILRFLEDMSYEAIAGVVGCQLGTVRSRLHYAKLALRRTLERENDRE